MDGACRRERALGRYQPRRPSGSVLYRCVQEHFETWLAHCHEGHYDAGPVPAHVEREFRRYLEWGILAHGFARARCGQCGHDFLIAFSCKGRSVCPSHCVVIDGVFDSTPTGGVIFSAASGLEANAIAQVPATAMRPQRVRVAHHAGPSRCHGIRFVRQCSANRI